MGSAKKKLSRAVKKVTGSDTAAGLTEQLAPYAAAYVTGNVVGNATGVGMPTANGGTVGLAGAAAADAVSGTPEIEPIPEAAVPFDPVGVDPAMLARRRRQRAAGSYGYSDLIYGGNLGGTTAGRRPTLGGA